MKIEIRNLGGIIASTIELHSKVTIMAGRNGSGKTSQLLPVMQALTGQFPSTPAECREMIREGHASGTLKITGDGGTYEVAYPGCKPVSQGWPRAGVYAAGLRRFAEEKPAVIGEYLQKLLKTEPTILDLAHALKEREITKGQSAEEAKATCKTIWENIQRKGWDGAWKDYQERGLQWKRDWKATTGETYGSAKGPNWRPEGWDDSLYGKSVETLRAELTEQESMLEALIRVEAVDSAEIERLERQTADISEVVKKRDAAITRADELEAQVREANERLKKLPRPAAQVVTFPCPHCNEPIDSRTKQKPPASQTKEELAAIQAALEKAEAECKSLGVEFDLAANQVLMYRSEFYTKDNLRDRLAELKRKGAQQAPPAEEIEKLRNAVAAARQRLEAFTLKTKADTAHDNVVKNQLLIDLLEPDGWRRSFSASALTELNEKYLAPFSERCGCPVVEISSTLDITWGGRHYRRCSPGERWLINALFQVAFAILEGADLMVFDEAGILDPVYASKFFGLLTTCPIPSLVALTRGRSRVPNLKGSGISYWAEGNTSTAINFEEVPA